ncbi:MAG: alpha-amylase, partial [Treponema sp.]|nr:alpha-amylase [Treponema sp.]
MKPKISIILGSNNHLPSGSGEDEFETLYSMEIKPLISTLYKFPRICMVFHYSGVLLYWIERRHPELFMILEDLLARKQAELLGGGFYEPMMPLVPLADKLGQIEMLTTYLRRQFGKRPQGCWIPALAWEQNLVSPLNACGMSYTFLEDAHFASAGANPGAGNTYAPCITEDQGKLLTVFPVASGLGREFSQNRPFAGLEKLKGLLNGEQEHLVTVFPSRVAKENAELEFQSFFEELSNADPRFEFTLPGRIFKNLRGLEKHYFCGIPETREKSPVRPRQFLVDCPEANGIYAKMMYTHTLINQLRGDKSRKRTALEELWKAQDCGLFCTGSPPCLSRSLIRKTAYRALLEAEKITREKGRFTPSLSVFDFDLDGEGEFLFQEEKLNCYVKAEGAGIFELDYLPKAWNYLDLFVPPNSSPLRRRGFSDYLASDAADVPGNTGAARFCGNEIFDVQETDRVHKKVRFRLPPKEGLPFGSIEMEKTWWIKKNTITVRYSLKNAGDKPESFFLVPSIDLSFPGEGESFVRILTLQGSAKEALASGGDTAKDLSGLEFRDLKNEAVLSLESNRRFDARILPVRTGEGAGAE